MKARVILNRYPANYVEEPLPKVFVELRYRKDGSYDRERASRIADKIEAFLETLDD